MDEFALIDWIRLNTPRRLRGPGGIGDDAAMLPPAAGRRQVVTNDVLVDGIDFRLRDVRPEIAAHKALSVNLSDLAAMGARPEGFTIALGLPRAVDVRWVKAFYRGLWKTALRYGIRLLGGDFSRSDTFFVSITALGSCDARGPVLRQGARARDVICVTGHLGGSLEGSHLSFAPRVKEALWLVKHVRPSAMIDLSDGLYQDLGHLLQASQKGARIDLETIPVSPAARKRSGRSSARALKAALSDGEDFELLFTVSSRNWATLERKWKQKFPQLPISRIGRIGSGRGIRWYREGVHDPGFHLKKTGYRHFSE